MAMAHDRYSQDHRHPRARRRAARSLLALPLTVFFGALALAIVFVAYLLWPRWPSEPVAIDAPSLPITVSGVVFNIPPAAIRNAMQRRPGTQERIDLAFLWPSLTPPDPAVRPTPPASPIAVDRVFVTISGGEGMLPPSERVKNIYPRYLEQSISTGPGGLASRPFREGTPYQGEDLLHDPQNAERFLVRCTQNGSGNTLGICLYERRIGAADLIVRFPRDWLANWPDVQNGIERLIASLKASPR
jgi:hypothetical protein